MNPNKKILIKDLVISAPSRRTSDAYFKREFEGFGINGNLQSLSNADESLQRVYHTLKSSELFDIVDITLNVRGDEHEPYYTGDVQLYVKEKGIPQLKIESSIQSKSNGSNGNVGAEIQGKLRNPLGYGETLRMTYSGNASGQHENSLSATFPHAPFNNFTSTFLAKSSEDNSSYHTSFSQKYKSFFGEIVSPSGQTRLISEVSIRDESPLTHDSTAYATDTSLPILDLISPSVKSSIKLVHSIDSRDSHTFPTKGYLVSSNLEVAGPPGDARFIRSNLQLQYHKSLLNSPTKSGLTLSFGGNIGIIHPLQTFFHDIISKLRGKQLIPLHPPTPKVYLSDRYHGGGPFSLRGFSIFGVGPRADPSISGGSVQGDIIGGLVKTDAVAALSCPLPAKFRSAVDGSTFLYATAGSIGQGNFNSLSLQQFFGYPRVSVGSGLALNISNAARLEVTYSLPLVYAKHDIVKPFQVGIGLTIN